MTRFALFALVICAACLSGCVSMSRSSPVQALPDDWASNARIDEIQVTRGDIKVSPQFDETFKARVKAKLDACATGVGSAGCPWRNKASIATRASAVASATTCRLAVGTRTRGSAPSPRGPWAAGGC